MTLSKIELRKLRKIGSRAFGEFEGKDSMVEEDMEIEEEEEGLPVSYFALYNYSSILILIP